MAWPTLFLVGISSNCLYTSDGHGYTGVINQATSGKDCVPWTEQTQFTDVHFPMDKNVAAACNFCRNPDGDSGGLWCYTQPNGEGRETCTIPDCGNFICLQNCLLVPIIVNMCVHES